MLIHPVNAAAADRIPFPVSVPFRRAAIPRLFLLNGSTRLSLGICRHPLSINWTSKYYLPAVFQLHSELPVVPSLIQ